MPDQAVLLADDEVTVSVSVAAGSRLEIVEPGGTVAYAMRGRSARWDVRVDIEDGGHLSWLGEPFIVSEGADVVRTLGVTLGASATLSLRETLVLGRSGEGPGHLVSRTDVRQGTTPLLVEAVDTAVGLGGHRVLDQLLCVGPADCPEDCPEDAMVLASGGHLHRWLGDASHLSPVRCTPPPRGAGP